MNTLLAEMAADSGKASDQIDELEEGKLDAIARLANKAAELEAEVVEAERLLKQAQNAYREITDDQLPAALDAVGLEKFTMKDGSEISVKETYHASIPVNRRPEAYTWLRDHDFGDIVKNNVTVSFGRGEDKAAKAFVDLCDTKGYVPDQIEKVEPSTLRAWLRERVESGDPVPLDLFGAFIRQRATLKRSK